MTNIGTTYINKSSNWWLYVEHSMLIWSLIQYVDGIITICIELVLGLFWHNLHFFNMHSMDKILSMMKQHKLISYWIDDVITFIKMDFQCHCISHKSNTLKCLKNGTNCHNINIILWSVAISNGQTTSIDSI